MALAALAVAGLGFAGLIALVALRAGALTGSGALAAIAVGTLTFTAFTWQGTAVLLAFFASSVLLSRAARRRALGADPGVTEKGATRDAAQVLANGGAAALCAVWALVQPGETLVAFTGFAGALAAATADTWATEIGTMLGGAPRSILSGRPVERGLSGGISLAGTLATVAGAAWVAAVALAVLAAAPAARSVALRPALLAGLGIACAGILGSLLDSALGASLQEARACDDCGAATERPRHTCGRATRVVRGLPGFGNDAVNAVATAAGAALAVAGLLAVA